MGTKRRLPLAIRSTPSVMTDLLSDRELADRVVSGGDEAAFQALYLRHTPTVLRFALRLSGGDVAEAEDLVQDAWLTAARGLAGFEWKSTFRTWLIGIVLNRIRELALRNCRRITTVEGEWQVPVEAAEPGVRIDVERALELLPPGFRTVLVLHDVQGFTHREIAERLGIAEGTSKSQLHEARKATRRLLTGSVEMSGDTRGSQGEQT
jgi:RNA polymerase sigma-70 factor (ECF subfamily)